MKHVILASAFVVQIFFSVSAFAYAQDQDSSVYLAAGSESAAKLQTESKNMAVMEEIYTAVSLKSQGKLGKHCKLETQEQFEAYQKSLKDPELLLSNQEFMTQNQALGMYVSVPTVPTVESVDQCFMNDRELTALKMYTGSSYYELNTALRQKNKVTLKRYRLITKYIISALNKLKSFVGYVKRGSQISGPELALHQVGATVPYPAFTSTSVASGFSGHIRYVIYSKSCRYVDPFSSVPGEEEVLCLPGTKFQIRYRKDEASSIKILMEEVGQQFDIDQLLKSLEAQP